MNWHLLSINEISNFLKTSPQGLNDNEASKIAKVVGENKIVDTQKKSTLSMFFSQFTDFMVLVLIVAAIISGFIGDIVDTIVIIAIVFINSIIGFIQEFRAEKTMEALKLMAASNARIVRNGRVVDVEATVIVPGDVVMLEAGNIIPADVCRCSNIISATMTKSFSGFKLSAVIS